MHALRDEAMPGRIVAEQHDQVGAEVVGLLDNGVDAFDVHPWFAGVHVGDGGDGKMKVVGPARELQVVARDARAQQRLDATA